MMSIYVNPSEWRLQTDGGIPYKLLEGFPKATFGDRTSVQEEIVIRSSDLYNFYLESFAFLYYRSGGVLGWTYPRQCPGFLGMWTKTIDIEPFLQSKPADPFNNDTGADDGTYSEFLKLTISFEPSQRGKRDTPGTESDPSDFSTFLEVSCEAGAEWLVSQGSSGMRWIAEEDFIDSDDPLTRYYTGDEVVIKDPTFGIRKWQPITTWTVTWPRVRRDALSIILARMRACLGKTNSTVVPLLHDAAAETVTFLGWSLRLQDVWAPVDKQPPVAIDMKFEEKYFVEDDGTIKGVNYQWIPEVNKVAKVVLSDGEPLYKTFDFNTMWAL